MLVWFAANLQDYAWLTSHEFPVNGAWIGIGIMFYFFSDLFNIGFNRSWGRWPHYIFVLLLVIGIGVNYVHHGGFWGAATGWLVYVMYMTVTVAIGLSFMGAAVLATPG